MGPQIVPKGGAGDAWRSRPHIAEIRIGGDRTVRFVATFDLAEYALCNSASCGGLASKWLLILNVQGVTWKWKTCEADHLLVYYAIPKLQDVAPALVQMISWSR